MHTARIAAKTCFAGTQCVWSPFNEHAKREKERTKLWMETCRCSFNPSSVVINRSILIYMARSQFAVLNMLVLYFSPKHVKWEKKIEYFFCNLLTRKMSNVFQNCLDILRFMGRMSFHLSPSQTLNGVFD
jgi:hypothetical protein